MPWNLPGVPAPAPQAPAPTGGSTPPAYDWNATLPGNNIQAPLQGSPTAPGGSATPEAGGTVNTDFEKAKMDLATAAANIAYLQSKAQNESDQVAINKAVAAANQAYQQASLSQGVMQQGITRATNYNAAQAQYEHSGVASSQRQAGLQGLGTPPPIGAIAAQLGLDQNDPRVVNISQAMNQMAGQSGANQGALPAVGSTGTFPGAPAPGGTSGAPAFNQTIGGFPNQSQYSVAAPNTNGYFKSSGTNLGPAANAFLRPDMANGFSNTASDFSPAAYSELLSAYDRGQVSAARPEAPDLISRMRAGTISPEQLAALSPRSGY